MATAKDIYIAPIAAKDANRLVDSLHYSHTHVQNSQLHLGVFLNERLEGVMPFGPSMDKRKVGALVKDTSWNGFIELNRMAFSEALPRNSESRALSIALKLIKKHYPHIEWIVSFADGQQCGDGTIYRAAGFVLTGYSSGAMWELPENLVKYNGGLPVAHRVKIQTHSILSQYLKKLTKGKTYSVDKYAQMFGGKVLLGYNFRYLYFLNKEARSRLTVPVLPFSTIDKLGARIYRGVRHCAGEAGDGGDQPHSESAALIRPLQELPKTAGGKDSLTAASIEGEAFPHAGFQAQEERGG